MQALAASAAVLYFGVGILQLAAIISGIGYWLGVHWIISAFIAVFLAWFPIVGPIAGFTGAIYAWDWPWPYPAALFFGVFAVAMAFALIGGLFETLRDRRY